MRKYVLWGVVVLVVGAVVWVLLRGRPARVDVSRIERGPIRSFVEDEGHTQVRERFVVSASVSGRLGRIALDEGDVVAKDDLVAEIDPLPLQSRVEEAEASVRALRRRIEGVETKKPKSDEVERARVVERKAREAVTLASRTLEELRATHENALAEEKRLRRLARTNVVSESDYEAAQTAERQARQRVLAQEVRRKVVELEVSIATLSRQVLESRLNDFDWEKKQYAEQIAGVEAKLASMRDEVRRTKIFAPAGGRVLAIHRESEQFVTAGTPILDIGNLNELEVQVDFLSEDVAHMREDMPAEVFGRALGERIVPGKVTRIHPSAFRKVSSLGVEQQRVNVIVSLEDGVALGDQYRVEVRVVLDRRGDAVLVPEGALFRAGGAWHVFVIREGRAQQRKVVTGLRDGTQREVLEGLEAGEDVVLHPGREIEDGMRVEVLGRE